MTNLIKAIETEEKKKLEDFIFSINQIKDFKSLDTWQYNDLLPKGKSIANYLKSGNIVGHFEAVIKYLIARKQKAVYKEIEREVKKVQSVFNAGELTEVKITIEWKKSKMWGSNPTAEAWYQFKDGNGFNSGYVKTGSIGGCGYDKQSTAVADCLNKINEVLKPLYSFKNDNYKGVIKESDSNNGLFGYGSGYGILPSIEGGVGVSCYNKIFNTIGYEFKTVASGSTFDVYTITKKVK